MPKKRQLKRVAKEKKSGLPPPADDDRAKRGRSPGGGLGWGHVHSSMNVMEIIALHPGAAEILSAYGLHCHGCAFNQMDSLEAGARSHGLGDDEIANITSDLNELLKTAPKRPASLTLTTPAAEALLGIAKAEKKRSCLLRVTTDEGGGFCMEFAEKKEKGDKTFGAPGIKDVALIASPEALVRVGGATVDFREGRFKLDLPKQMSCSCGGKCSCRQT